MEFLYGRNGSLDSEDLTVSINELAGLFRTFLRTGEDFEIVGDRNKTWDLFSHLQIEGLRFIKAIKRQKPSRIDVNAEVAKGPRKRRVTVTFIDSLKELKLLKLKCPHCDVVLSANNVKPLQLHVRNVHKQKLSINDISEEQAKITCHLEKKNGKKCSESFPRDGAKRHLVDSKNIHKNPQEKPKGKGFRGFLECPAKDTEIVWRANGEPNPEAQVEIDIEEDIPSKEFGQEGRRELNDLEVGPRVEIETKEVVENEVPDPAKVAGTDMPHNLDGQPPQFDPNIREYIVLDTNVPDGVVFYHNTLAANDNNIQYQNVVASEEYHQVQHQHILISNAGVGVAANIIPSDPHHTASDITSQIPNEQTVEEYRQDQPPPIILDDYNEGVGVALSIIPSDPHHTDNDVNLEIPNVQNPEEHVQEQHQHMLLDGYNSGFGLVGNIIPSEPNNLTYQEEILENPKDPNLFDEIVNEGRALSKILLSNAAAEDDTDQDLNLGCSSAGNESNIGVQPAVSEWENQDCPALENFEASESLDLSHICVEEENVSLNKEDELTQNSDDKSVSKGSMSNVVQNCNKPVKVTVCNSEMMTMINDYNQMLPLDDLDTMSDCESDVEIDSDFDENLDVDNEMTKVRQERKMVRRLNRNKIEETLDIADEPENELFITHFQEWFKTATGLATANEDCSTISHTMGHCFFHHDSFLRFMRSEDGQFNLQKLIDFGDNENFQFPV